MLFKSGHIPWNKGLTKENDIRMARISEKVSVNPNVAWCKGLTNETGERVHRRSLAVSIVHTGKPLSQKHKAALKGKTGVSKWTPKMRKEIPIRIKAAFSSPEVRKFRSEHSKWLWQQD